MRKAIIFDLDGTLADSEPAHERAIRSVVESHGMSVTPQQFLELCVGFGEIPALRNIARANGRDCSEEQLQAMSATKQDLFEAGLATHGVPACPGGVELLRAAASQVPVAVCSGSPRRTVEALLVALGVRDLLKVVVSLNDVSRGKPDPEPYQLTSQRMGIEPADCVAIEDTSAGVRSAVGAGLWVVAVGHSLPASQLGEAHAFVRHIADLTVDDLLNA